MKHRREVATPTFHAAACDERTTVAAAGADRHDVRNATHCDGCGGTGGVAGAELAVGVVTPTLHGAIGE